ELREAVQEAAARASGELIGVEDLPQPLRDTRNGGTLEALEVDHIRRALEQAGGNQRRAARALGISRWSLSRRLRKHGLRPAGESEATAIAGPGTPDAARRRVRSPGARPEPESRVRVLAAYGVH